jgi:hypothetical protein
MAETTITEQIVREAPEIEALKLGLVQSAKSLADTPIQLPEQQIAGLSGLQQPICLHTPTHISSRLSTPLLQR